MENQESTESQGITKAQKRFYAKKIKKARKNHKNQRSKEKSSEKQRFLRIFIFIFIFKPIGLSYPSTFRQHFYPDPLDQISSTLLP